MNRIPIALALTTALACGMATAQSSKPAGSKPAKEAVSQIIDGWPKDAQHTARKMLDKYGTPNEATPTQLIWFNNGPWKRTIVQKEEINHAFPMPHKDVMEQVVDYKVPPEKLPELAKFDGSVYIDRTRGEISARCDMEEANILALNLAHEIVTGKRGVDDAREFYPKAVMAHLEKPPTTYTQKLQFAAQKNAAFPDQTIVSQDMVQKATKIKKEMMAQDDGKAGSSAGATKSKSSN
jgi:hypothetical protein